MSKIVYRSTNRGVTAKGTWPKTKHGALNESIRKWEFIVQTLKDGAVAIKNDGATNTCALCHIYNTDRADACYGCPVNDRTSQAYCNNTPYDDWANEHSLENARDELTFLRSVKPVKTTKGGAK